VRRITSRIGSAIGAAMILACAAPAAARAQQPVPQPRAAAQWLGRRAAARQMLRWRMARPRMALGWRRGYARGWAAAARHPFLAARWQRGYTARVARARMYGRFWERRRLARMGARWWL